jgi:hypothetical protein
MGDETRRLKRSVRQASRIWAGIPAEVKTALTMTFASRTFATEVVDHPEEAGATIRPLLQLPDGHDRRHRPAGPLDDVLVTLVVNLLEELAEALADLEGVQRGGVPTQNGWEAKA